MLLRGLDQEVDADLRQGVAEVRSLASGRDPQTGRPFGGDVTRVFDVFLDRNVPGQREAVFTYVDGQPHRTIGAPGSVLRDPAIVRRWTNLAGPQRGHFISPRAGRTEYFATPLSAGGPRGVFVVVFYVDGEREEIDDALRTAVAVFAGVFLMAITIAWFVLGRVVRPLVALANTAHGITTARAITSGGQVQRLPESTGDDEVAELTRSFNAMLERLASSFAAQQAFVADAGHELRTPITIVRGHLELMGDDPQDRRETVELVTEELDRMARMVSDLLLLASATATDFVRLEPVDVGRLLRNVQDKTGVLARHPVELDGAPELVVSADAQRITQALVQLVQNATQHSPPGRPIRIGGAVADRTLYLWVQDRGSGVPAEDRERIFRRFARVSRGGSGAGLGLSIVAAIADAHGGSAEVLSSVGTGSAFLLLLPLGGDGALAPTEPVLDDRLRGGEPVRSPRLTSPR